MYYNKAVPAIRRCCPMTKNHDKAPREFAGVEGSVKKGLIIVNTGDGKGKSTAAFGTALRAMGQGVQSGHCAIHQGQLEDRRGRIFKKLKGQAQIYSMGDGFTLGYQNFEEDVKTAARAWKKCRELLHDNVHPACHL